MPYGLYMSAEGVQAQSKRMEVLANNLANVNTVGFKRDYALFQARFAEAIDQGLVSPGAGGIDDIGGGIEVAKTVTQFSPGPLKVTGTPTDLAIQGDGFFQVKHGDSVMLTRAGNFQIDQNGVLRTQAGEEVLSESKQPIAISPETPWTFVPSGALQQDGNTIPLGIVRPQSLGDLVKRGDNLFEPLGTVKPVPQTERRVAVGTLEMSAVNPTSGMLELIETSRAIEANMKLIQNQDNMIGSLISRLLTS